MKLWFLVFICICYVPITSAQGYKYQFSFGEFDNAESFIINPSGFIYIADPGADEVYKYDTLGTLRKETGGYGWDNDSFDDPVDVYATSLNMVVADKNNHRVQLFDKDLNFISTFYTRESDNRDAQFGYPLSCVVSSQGDLYILDSENNRVVKFDMFGNFLLNFGGYDAGGYSLTAPAKLSVSPIGYVYVLDKNRIVVFDQYGNGLSEISTRDSIASLNIIFNQMTVNSVNEVFNMVLNSSELSLRNVTYTGNREIKEIRASLLYYNKLFLLSPNEVLVFEKEQ